MPGAILKMVYKKTSNRAGKGAVEPVKKTTYFRFARKKRVIRAPQVWASIPPWTVIL